MSLPCPDCGDPLSIHGVCGSCGYGVKAKKKSANYDPEEAARNAELVAAARQRYRDTGPTSNDLTDQQWAAVCRFFPGVAEHCKRIRIGPDDPLWATAKLGPMMRGGRRMLPAVQTEADDERLAIQAEQSA